MQAQQHNVICEELGEDEETQQCRQSSSEDEEEDEEVGEMKAKFDKIMATFVEDQNNLGGRGVFGQASTP